MTPDNLQRSRKRATAAVLFCVVGGMVGLSFAAVPLYELFCQVTGYGGTTQRADSAPGAGVGAPVIKVRFDANTAGDLPWGFKPQQTEIRLVAGDESIARYWAVNRGAEDVVGTATFNVTPHKAGPYFNKVQCFCFTEQRLAAGESMEMPVIFWVDPAIHDDPNTQDVKTITLSYTFFRDPNQGPDQGKAGNETAARTSAGPVGNGG